MQSTIANLRERFPLPDSWQKIEIFSDTVTIAGDDYNLIGVAAAGDDVPQVTGASISTSAGASDMATLRAYFELLERTAIVQAMRAPAAKHQLLNLAGQPLATIDFKTLWPQSPTPERWQFAKSNGIAAHTAWDAACHSAAYELIERDRILRSWYFGATPQAIELTSLDLKLPTGLAQHYEVVVYDLPSGSHLNRINNLGNKITVRGVFALPKTNVIGATGDATSINKPLAAPLVYGFAASACSLTATRKAADECLQRMAFLWGETFSADELTFSPTPDFHQAFYQQPSSRPILEAWLAGQLKALPRQGTSSEDLPTTDNIHYVDITPSHLKGKAYVVKAHCDIAERLFFGRRWEDGEASAQLHPVA